MGRFWGRSSGTRGRCSVGSGFVLVIAEKPKAGRRIAEALGGKSVAKCSINGAPYWVFRYNGSLYVVGVSVGHLFGLTTSARGFPVFEYEWAPLWSIDKSAGYTRRYYEALRRLARGASLYVNACDYDIEGSVIGYLIVKWFGRVDRARRAKFSTLTDRDIRRAFARLEPLDWPMIEAGLARHELDWLWGVNISRALMDSVRLVTGRRVVLSAGRVQSPTLLEAVSREKRRRLHVPLPSYRVAAMLRADGWSGRVTLATYDRRDAAERVAAMIRAARSLVVESVERYVRTVAPPPPFNLTDLQLEAARIYGYSPAKTQEAAERLYLDALISYPRTNSQKIPSSIDVEGIVVSLAASRKHGSLAALLLQRARRPLRPRQGAKDDPAHPAIHPTGRLPEKGLGTVEERVYDLVVRRFLASMAWPARIASVKAVLRGPAGVRVVVTGVRVVEEGWYRFYPYSRPREEELPSLSPGDRVVVERVWVREELSGKPEAYTKASLVKWMESRGIGTEATRARIVELLFERGYLRSDKRGRITVTDLGFAVAEVLAAYFPQIVSVGLTREFERLLEDIRAGRATRREVVEKAKRLLLSLLEDYKASRMREAGVKLAKSLGLLEPQRQCPICGREAVDGSVFCEFHAEAYAALREAYRVWATRAGTSWKQVLERVAQARTSGEWVREVALYLLENE